ncbi:MULTISPECIES: LacI family DNA-binding transcriptional regulator [unclassified Streptomyces]|uniref:LacI family DNA-binding transcriptional regulator n=1 Tax=unclassified Streptomyces TaxID=2593676 RepID=UPI002025865E|nr:MULTISPECIES: LacI family DNA-binding transcriptional regulator [unclassified Streptomyces]MCX4553610.1 LacI family transcriptional regulator [Streptomyces sp. NBC_01500]WSC18559.1 LacI family transcriptional regulator [Streptomyces sp. NBC_01766]WSV52600.1 LacI family transcriptional regulator [Streptomyces sp. NBC_01014]
MKVGIVEIAARAGVSEATVSRVINRRQGVAKKTRDAVEAAMTELGYERVVEGQLVAVITEHVSNPFFADLAERIEAFLAPHGLKTVLCPAFPGGVQERDFIASIIDKGIAAVVYLSSSNTVEGADTEAYGMLRARRIPYLGINGGFADKVPAPVYSTDDALAAELAVDHLYRLGHRAIGMASGPLGNHPADRRVRGFLDAMEQRGSKDAESWVMRQSYSVEGGQAAAQALLQLGATAIVAASDYMALGAIRGIRRQGYTVPHDVSVVGYDGSMITEFVDPPLTTVRQPGERLALEVGRSVLSLVSGRDVPTGELLFDPELVIRSTTGPPPHGTAVGRSREETPRGT